MARLFSRDPVTGIERHFHYDAVKDEAVIETRQDVEPCLEINQGLHNLYDQRAHWRGDMHRVASIPLPIYYELKRQGIVDDEKAFKRWLNDPANSKYRTRPGKV